MPQGGDLLQQLLEESISTSAAPPGWSGAIFAPPTEGDMAARRAPAVNAILQTLMTGKEPVAVPKYNRGGLLGRLGLTSQFQTPEGTGPGASGISPELRNQIAAARQITGQAAERDKLDKLQMLLQGTGALGTEWGKQQAINLGVPEFAQGMPAGMEGKGQLAQQAAFAKLQQGLLSTNIKEQELAQRELHDELTNAIAMNKYDTADQLINLKNQAAELAQQRYETSPIYKSLDSEMRMLGTRYDDLLKDRKDAAELGQDTKYYDDALAETQSRMDEIQSGMAEAGTDVEKLRKLLMRRPGARPPEAEGPRGATGDIPPIKKGLLH